jgi:hypothetical protein
MPDNNACQGMAKKSEIKIGIRYQKLFQACFPRFIRQERPPDQGGQYQNRTGQQIFSQHFRFPPITPPSFPGGRGGCL